MVPTQAPKTASLDSNAPSSSWLETLTPPSAWRVKGFSIWTLTLGALLLSSLLNATSEAQNNRATDPTTQAISADSSSQLSTQPPSQLASQPTSSSHPNSSPGASPEIHSSVATASPAPQGKTIRFTVFIAGKKRTGEVAVTPKMTVGQSLAAIGISLAVLDRVTPDAAALARDGMNVRVNRVSTSIARRRIAIPAEVRYQPTPKLKAGAKQVVQYPSAGYYEVCERLWQVDGKTTKREFVSQKVAVAPKNKIVALGTYSHLLPGHVPYHRRYAQALSARGGSPRDRAMISLAADESPNTFRVVKTLTIKTSAYAAGRAGGAVSNWTATGLRCTYGAVAVDPRLIPLGSKLYIEGYGYGFACDTGGAIKGHRIDLAFNSARAAFHWGRRTAKVHILAP